MRALVSRGLLLSPLVCAALVFGPLGTAAAAVDAPRVASGGAAAAWSSADSDAVLEQLGVLDRVDHYDVALDPLLDELSTLAEREAGTLDAVEAAGLARAVETANASLQQRLKERAGVTSDTSDRAGVAAADPVSDLVAQLQSAVDGLLKALTSLDLGAVLGAVTGLLSPVLGLITGLLGGATSALTTLPALPTAGSPAAVG
ncbi:hypothetical protein [Streptomyces sp. NBC_00038]|uniref:hypothetical protein n=1 Tax=Streptomyces sp. NBC_00038 TaxID=2903615 RepID=UPI0022508D3F|nr:hypothetical protein [Streptomyces sp. NBC_00038]MCX5555556.1 hypothetical protein [Streptomyces sp. NBC_00038]